MMPISQFDASSRAISGNPGESGWVRHQPMVLAVKLENKLAYDDMRLNVVLERVNQVSPLN